MPPLYEVDSKQRRVQGVGRSERCESSTVLRATREKHSTATVMFHLSRLITSFWSNFSRYRQGETPATAATRLVAFIGVIKKHVVRQNSN